ncbi:ketol-acid reductoisomerase [Candidatus Gottesmanbacteria bacterium RBG_13_37_7]|uniref:Ketol-acid reductoisomerase n=1 Tax=Candidatus Gottesmanbacteria bacterium RBG_13_37_7 TaxID=1798369 RepID=A0A1F5YH13_9BACT|nr:MAG: ketol-acid reductoisomerase [Candidatus Gottesmanbacteria bacterium RBG_13_37_7]
MRIKFGNVRENVITREEYSLSKARKILKDETISVIGYGVQGQAQALNLRDNGLAVIIGQRSPSVSFDKAVKDGWRKGQDLFSIEEASRRGTIVAYLLSDAGQVEWWPKIKNYLSAGKALYFSHGFAITYQKLTKIFPSPNIDVIMVAPKGSGRSVRMNFLTGSGINASFAIDQDHSGKARDRVLSIGIGIGSGFLFETTFKNEVYSDLTGERGILMGALAGVMEAQYSLLRNKGHTPSEAFNETVEELTQSLIKLVGEKGMDYMFANCSATAQRGAMDWKRKFRQAVTPVFDELYSRVKNGDEAGRVLRANSKPDYKKMLEKELDKMRKSEMWQTGKVVRSLRPKEEKKKND